MHDPTDDFDDSLLRDPDAVQARIEAMDAIEIALESAPDARLQERWQQLDTVHRAFVQSLRHDATLRQRWLTLSGDAAPGAHRYDWRDTLLADVLQLPEPAPERPLAPEMVFYQPTPARHAMAFLRDAALTEHDTLIDLGSGLGHVPLLAAMTTSASCIGIEQDPALVASAQASAQALDLTRARLLAQDVRDADLAIGTVFYLYTPFTGAMLRGVLETLRDLARGRTLRIGSLGPCTRVLAGEDWLAPQQPPDEHALTIFRSQGE